MTNLKCKFELFHETLIYSGHTSVRRGETTVPWPALQTLKIKKVKTVLSKTCFQNAQKCVFLGVILQTFPRGMPPDPPRMVVPSALPLWHGMV